MKNSVFGGITVAISFTMVSQWMQILLLFLGICSAMIPVIKTVNDYFRNRVSTEVLKKELSNAQYEIWRLKDKYEPEEVSE